MAGQVMESEFSDGSFSPSAPPRNSRHSSVRADSPKGIPRQTTPRYNAVLAQDPQARQMAADIRRRGLTDSLANAGKKYGFLLAPSSLFKLYT